MRYKSVPLPRSVDELLEIRDAVPLVPKNQEDCCSRIATRTTVAGRDSAREWLTFLRALGFVSRGDRGFYRIRTPPDRDAVAERFREHVFGAREILTAASHEGEIDDESAFEALRESVPRWERHHHDNWERTWRERTRRLLDWGVIFGILEADGDERYRAVGD